jgi:catechol 2,3-dioxygenase-like lactoylglutathione lyase family enzyme
MFMASLRHIAICVRDLEASARFYEEVFGLKRVGEETIELGSGIYLSDGVVNLALLKMKSTDFVGTHHFGFIVEDSARMRERIEAHGGSFFFALGNDAEKLNFELKFKDPDGIIFDISQRGWLGSSRGSA